MNLNICKWKYFKISKLFEDFTGKDLIIGEIEQGNIPIASNSVDNNNIVAYTKKIPNRKLFDHKISISIADRGKFWAFIQPKDFYISTRAKALVSKNPQITINQLAFITTIINRESFKFCYGRNCCDNLPNIQIKLPIQHNIDGSVLIDDTHEYSDEGYIPDWKFMEDYIKGLHCKPITTKNEKHLLTGIYTQKWKEFKISNLFDVVLSKGDIKIDDVEQGNIPLVSSGETNNGIVGYISNDGDGKAEIFDGNLITVDMFCNAFYQKEPFYAVSHGRVNILLPKFKLTSYIAMFICALIKQEQYKFSYGRAVYSTVCENIEIKLPILSNSEGLPIIDEKKQFSEEGYIPNWQSMENYIKSLPYGDRI